MVSPAGDEKLSVSISRMEQNPTVEDRRVFTEFATNYPLLVPLLSAELFKLWRMLRLEVVYIFPRKPLQLLFAFRGDVWPDAIFNVAVDGTHVEGLSLDD